MFQSIPHIADLKSMGPINSYSSIPVNVNVSIWWIFAFCKSPIRVELWWGGLLYGRSFLLGNWTGSSFEQIV